jgi:chorismate mutase
MSGLMIEVHPDPLNALSDSTQQLDYKTFSRLLSGLIIRNPTTNNKRFLNQLEELRHKIDSIDHQLVDLIAARMDVSEKMGEYKCRNNVTILQMERWLEILRTRTEQGLVLGLEKTFVEEVMKLLHQESIRIQTDKMNTLRTKGECGSEEK